MKKLVCIAMIAFAGLGTVKAQKTSGFELGANVGINFSVVSEIDGQNSTDYLTSFNFGISGEYYFSDRWGIKMKLISDSKGWGNGFITDQNLNIITTDYELSYVTIPVMANWHFGSTRKWYLHFGPYVGFLTKAEDSELSTDVKSFINDTDFGLAVGIGYKFPVGEKAKLFFEYDAQSGFTDVFELNNGGSVKNSRSSFNFGVLFSLD